MTAEPDKHSLEVAVPEAGGNAIDLLQAATNLPRQRIKHAMACGAVWLSSQGRRAVRLRRATRALQRGDALHIHYDPAVLSQQPPTPVLVDDAGPYSVWIKPSGMRSQGSKWGDHCTIMRWAEKHLEPQRNAFTVHRLDMPASGLIVVAHSKTAAANLSQQFKNRTVTKRYRARVKGDCRSLVEPVTVSTPFDGKQARSHIRCVVEDSGTLESVVEVRIETGRKHQIRRHLAELGFPIVGDRLYGDAQDADPDLQLTAVHLAFDHPDSNVRVVYEVPGA
jgi:tRNA pseudouridine32 synthase/23S rRNA pseudouridine746 synthase